MLIKVTKILLDAAKRVYPCEFSSWHDQDYNDVESMGSYIEADFSLSEVKDLSIFFYECLGNVRFVMIDVFYIQVIMPSQADIRMLYRKAIKHRDTRHAN